MFLHDKINCPSCNATLGMGERFTGKSNGDEITEGSYLCCTECFDYSKIEGGVPVLVTEEMIEKLSPMNQKVIEMGIREGMKKRIIMDIIRMI